MSDRKYGQRGYQESDERERSRGTDGPRPDRREGPRGRGLGRPTESGFACGRCGAKLPLVDPPAVDATCAHCGNDLHTCTNCRHFDTAARFECRQPIAQRIASKSKRNSCELFEPRLVRTFESAADRPDDARSAFDDLFKI